MSNENFDLIVIGAGPGGYVGPFVRHNWACALPVLKNAPALVAPA